LRGLQRLDLSGAEGVDDLGLSGLRGLAGGLRELSLARCRWIGDGGCGALAQVRGLAGGGGGRGGLGGWVAATLGGAGALVDFF
jgi:hypothetical protein